MKRTKVLSILLITLIAMIGFTACETDGGETGGGETATVTTPTVTPPGGTYTEAQTVILSTETAGASIYYTLDGTTPSHSSTLYSGPIIISTTSTLKAFAMKDGMTGSITLTAVYTIDTGTEQAAAPTAAPPGGTYTEAQTVALSTATAGASIYYTLNGTTPSLSSTLYSSPITIDTTCTLKAFAMKDGMTGSTTLTVVYTIDTGAEQAATPTAAPPGGTYNDAQTVILTTSTAGASIYYTLDGTTPSQSSMLYSDPITISSTSTLKVFAMKDGMTSSTTLTAVYTIDTGAEQAASLTAIPPGGIYNEAQTVTLTTATAGANIYYTLDGTTPTASSTLYSGPITISTASTLRAIAVKEGTNSTMLTLNYGFFEMVFVPGGSYEMGKNGTGGYGNVTPVHTVMLSGFYMGNYQVTQGQYEAVMGTNPSDNKTPVAPETSTANRPVEMISWYDAIVFCNKLSISEGLTPAYQISGSTNPADWGTVPTFTTNATWNAASIVAGSTGYRLPTEAQWEYAAKGGNGTPGDYTYSGSNTLNFVAWYGSNSGSRTHWVGALAPNELGLYDMSGNVAEWCWDWYESYSSEAQTNPLGASSGSGRVYRGGSYNDLEENVRSTSRKGLVPYSRSSRYIGFRLVRP